ncbi:tRNA pseudouridine(13) synthase TruD [Aggregicoccus sp. 17bor-14]|uniref:tRNA pseudouridine(13) synthase TruD n=1 Tax=Myxococcaceae TaxID=31 RepID=UPI0012F27DDC|nr:tRNA pseudouridine(13) synthase TruD [Simulacricoccus sp. 17bor-14]MRI86740.1 tRNA pseudouridine(13) synthase TruD [Aggregicoccus sp. 17bor-14]
MRIKQKPEDFSVKESYRFDEVAGGRFRVYLMDKQKLSTFDAADRIRERFGLKPGVISYCGLKDKQGRTEQLIAVDGADVDIQEPDLRLKYLGRTDAALSARNITSNRFSVTVRDLSPEDLGPLNVAAAEVNRLGVVNYFDSQRFGSLKHGQGFIAKDLIRGDYETALKNYLAKPSELDRSEDAKVKQFWRDNWGKWTARVPFEGSGKYFRVLKSLRDKPNDYLKAFLQIDSAYRAMLLFTYQSFLWNEGVRRLLQLTLPREKLFPLRYQAGTLLFHRDADADTLRMLRDATFPLLSPTSDLSKLSPQMREAVEWSLGKEKLKLQDLVVKDAPKLLYFKHEERPILSFPHKLVLGRPQADEVNRGQTKVNVAFTLPPGAYATLVVKRLFHFGYRDDTPEEIRNTSRGIVKREDFLPPEEAAAFAAARAAAEGGRSAPARGSSARLSPTRGAAPSVRSGAPSRTSAAPRAAASAQTAALAARAPAAPAETPAREEPKGFRDVMRTKKAAKRQAQQETAKRLESRRKK